MKGETNGAFAAERARMVTDQLSRPGRDVTDGTVLRAMGRVRREHFVPPALRTRAYADGPLPIGEGQTISQPYIVAKMTECLQLRPEHRILEIGTGCGYQTAVLAEIVAEVYSVEIVSKLAREAAERLSSLGYDHISLRVGDGHLGWPEAAPFDGILVTCAAPQIPLTLIDQLRLGARMVIPVGPQGKNQQLLCLQRTPSGFAQETLFPVRFVPMTSQ